VKPEQFRSQYNPVRHGRRWRVRRRSRGGVRLREPAQLVRRQALQLHLELTKRHLDIPEALPVVLFSLGVALLGPWRCWRWRRCG